MNNQNESPFGNPRFVISIVAVFLFLWGWQYYINKKYPQPLIKPNTAQLSTTPETGKPTVATKSIAAPTANRLEVSATEKIEKTFSYEDEKVKWILSSQGMGLNSLELKTYFDKENKPIIFSATDKLFSVSIENQLVLFELSRVSDTRFFGTASMNGKTIKRTLIYNQEHMTFETDIEFEAAPSKLSFSTTDFKRTPKSTNFLMPSFEIQNFLFKDSEKVKTEDISGLGEADVLNKAAANVYLASIGTQYFTQSYIDKSEILPTINMSVVGKSVNLDINYNLKDAKINNIKNIIYIGPKVTEILNKIDPVLPEVMDLGMFGFIAKPLLLLMKFMHGIFGNWGLAIIALTLVMRLLMLPFNIVSFKSMRAMQKIQPQLAAAREKYKNDPMAINRETMALMKEHKANPLSSCLPMLIQIPIFFALWKTIGSSIEIYQQPFFGWITDLSSYDSFFVLPVLMGVTMFFQQKLTPTTMDPMQAKILNFMPLLFSIFMISLPSGLTLYNFISSLFGAIQQYFLLKDNTKKQLT
ncbi:MAG: membrane protein insertase YidC [Bdellovibrionota bacterium]